MITDIRDTVGDGAGRAAGRLATVESTPPSLSSAEQRLLLALRGLAFALGGAYVLVLLYHATAIVAFPYDLNYGEGYILNDARRLVRGEPVYTDVGEFPMVRSPYPPFFLGLAGALTPHLGGGFLAGRFISVVAAFCCALLVFLGCLHLTRQRWVAAACGALYLGSPFLYQWIAFSRVDLLANALSLAAVVVVLRSGGGRLWLASGLCVLAALTKQTAVAAPFAITLWLLTRQPARAATFALLVAAPVAAATLSLNWVTEGQYWLHVWLGNASNPFNVGRMLAFWIIFLLTHPLLVFATMWLLGGRMSGAPAGWTAPIGLACLYAGATFFTTLTVGNEGSSINYFLEFLAAVCLLAGPAWAQLRDRLARPAAVAGVPLMLLVAQLLLFAHAPNRFGVWPAFFPPHGFTPTARDYAVGERLDAWVRSTNGAVLLEPAGLAVRNGREVLVQPIDLRAEQLHGRWDSAALNAAISERAFELVVLSFRLLPHDVLAKIEEHYELVELLEGDNRLRYGVYAPSSPARAD